MAKDKKSVLLYCDILHTVKELTDEEAGKLFKHYLEYVNDLNPTAPDKLTQIVFEPIKQNLKRDLVKWETKSKRNTETINEYWRKQNETNEYERIKVDTKNTDIVTDIVTVKENNIEDRKLKFACTISPYKRELDNTELKKFYDYWTEPNKSNTKFRQELEKTWDLKRRIDTWFSNVKGFNPQPKLNWKGDPIV